MLRKGVVFLLRLYQKWISPFWGPRCRFYPTCSQYALEAVTKYGVAKGLLLSILRISRCHPWHPGGHDPVP